MSKWDNETAEWYAEKYENYATNKLGVRALKLAENSTVVGTGCALRHASEQATSGTLVGIDPVPHANLAKLPPFLFQKHRHFYHAGVLGVICPFNYPGRVRCRFWNL